MMLHQYIFQNHQNTGGLNQSNATSETEAERAARINTVNDPASDQLQQLWFQIQLQQSQTQKDHSYLNQLLTQNSANSISNVSLMPPRQQDQLQHLMANLHQDGNGRGTNLDPSSASDRNFGTSASLLNNGRPEARQNPTTANTLPTSMLTTALPGQHIQHNLIHQNGLSNNPANAGSNLPYNSNSFSQNYLTSATSDSNPNTTHHGVSPLHNLTSLFSGKFNDGTVNKNKKKRKKKNKNQNQQNRPPRPLSAYNLFFKDERKKILASFAKIQDDKGASNDDDSTVSEKEDDQIFGLTAQSKGVGFENLAKTIGRRWKKISPERLEHYKALAKKDQDRYAEDMKVHEEKLRELWFQEQAAIKDKKEKEAKEVEAAEKANTFNTNDSKNPTASSSSEQCKDQGSDDDMTRGDGNEKRSRAGSKSVISIDAIADNDGSRTKKLKTSHEQTRQSQQQLPSIIETKFSRENGASPASSEGGGVNQGLVSSLFASSGKTTNAHQTLHGSNNLGMESTRLAVNQLESQIENLMRLKNQLVENAFNQQLLHQQEQQLRHQHQMTPSEATHQNNDLVQTLAHQLHFIQQGQVQNRPTHDPISNNFPVNNQMLNDMNAGLLNHTTGAIGGGRNVNENLLFHFLSQQQRRDSSVGIRAP